MYLSQIGCFTAACGSPITWVTAALSCSSVTKRCELSAVLELRRVVQAVRCNTKAAQEQPKISFMPTCARAGGHLSTSCLSIFWSLQKVFDSPHCVTPKHMYCQQGQSRPSVHLGESKCNFQTAFVQLSLVHSNLLAHLAHFQSTCKPARHHSSQATDCARGCFLCFRTTSKDLI
jgi:hypothetical protein